MPIDADDPRPPYAKIADDLRSAIRDGRYELGSQLPTAPKLAEQYGVARMTVRRALDILVRERYIIAHHGRGTFVREVIPDAATQPARPETLAVLSQRLDEVCDEVTRLRQELDELRAQLRPPES